MSSGSKCKPSASRDSGARMAGFKAQPWRLRWRTRDLIFSDEDVALFAAALEARYPRIRFVPYEYWNEQEKGGSGDDRRAPEINYRRTLTSPGSSKGYMCRAWLEPEGWRPVWSLPGERGYRFVENMPRLSFTWFTPLLHQGSWFDDNGRSVLNLGKVAAHYQEGDKEHLAFIRAVWRMIAQLSTNTVPWCYHDLAAGEVKGPYLANSNWIGHEAMRWVREDPRRCFFHRHRPHDAIPPASGNDPPTPPPEPPAGPRA